MSRDRHEEATGVADSSAAPGPEGNTNTVVFSLDSFERLAQRPLAPHQAFLAVHDRLRPVVASAEHAVAVVALDAKGRVVAEAALEDGRSLVIGRHSQCLFRLRARSVSLRQLAVHVRVEDGTPVTRLWDLRSGQPFATEDGAPAAAVVAEGPLFVSVGEYAVLFVPAARFTGGPWPADGEAAWRALPRREFIERRGATMASPAPARVRLEKGISRITRVDAPRMLGDEAPAAQAAGPPWAEVTVVDRDGAVRHRVSTEQIARGVLLGRSSRCQIGHDVDGLVSRVHLLIVRIGAEVWALDTASTNGTRRNGVNIEAVVLRAEDALELPGKTQVRFKRLAHAGA
jgi:hypothetical protein